MSKFLTNLNAELVSDKVWQLTKYLSYKSDLLDCTVLVPSGFQTDLASVPRIPIVYSIWGARAHREAVVHDYLFRSDAVPLVTFSVGNKVFLESMKATGKSVWIRWPMYIGVQLGSRAFYHIRKVSAILKKVLP
jgi:hypothetical protein